MLTKLFRRGKSCGEVLEVLQSYLDGETDEETARQVVAHLENCDRCDRESDIFRRIKSSLKKNGTELDPEVMTALSRFGERVARGEIS